MGLMSACGVLLVDLSQGACYDANEMKLLAMAPKFPTLFFSRRFPIWVPHSFRFASSAASVQSAPKSKEYRSAICFLEKNLHPDALLEVLDSMSDLPSATSIFRWASRQRNFQQTAQTYVHIILKLGAAGEGEEMEFYLKEMIKLDCFDRESNLGLLIESFNRILRPRQALKVFEIARSANLTIPLLSCNVLLGAFVSESVNFNVLLFVYKEMVKARLLPDVHTLNCIIKGLCLTDQLDSALSQFQRMEKKHCIPNSWTFELIICGLCSVGRAGEAVDIWKQMVGVHCDVHPEFYERILPLFCGANKLEEAVKLFKMMKDDGVSSNSYLYGVMIKCMCEHLQLENALKMFEEMTGLELTPTEGSYVDIVYGCCKLGKFFQAVKFLSGSDPHHSGPYDALISSFCDVGRITEAMSLLKVMIEKGLCSSLSWNIIIGLFCEKGNVTKAFEVLCRMIVSSYRPDDVTYSSLVSGYCKNSEFGKALQIFKKACTEDMPLDMRSCSELIEGLCRVKKIKEAAEVFYHVIVGGSSPDVVSLEILVEEMCFIGKIGEAIKVRLLASCNGIFFLASTCITIMIRILELNKERCVLPLLAQMLVEGYTLDLNSYCIMTQGLCVGGTTKVAADLFNRMVDDGIVPGSKKLEKLIKNFADSSNLKLVSRSLEKLVEGGELSAAMYNIVISGLLKEELKPLACKFLDWMLERDWVPDPHTHGLLVGSVDSEARADSITVDREDIDKISNILAEGLESSASHIFKTLQK
ncbi:Pentatricopeptide repeat-containing protein [Apostasia shenzhenica]|uniref:Pentatricopeptide repeat-containing protein n=1 Tax=Apostasia shenzhenica TaxID=1088818 RepID=A0A2I0B5F9_9ASPA|nr:Pentatricopeptide repeat-containing protein [Apostasia shenzhenica]